MTTTPNARQVEDAIVSESADPTVGQLPVASGTGKEITWADPSTAVLSNVDSITFNTAAGVSVSEGEIAWNADDDTLDIGLPGGSILQTGQEVVTTVRNSTGTTLVDGEAVYITGSTGNNTVVSRAQANGPTADLTIGIVTQEIPNGQNGLVTLIGKVRNFDTSMWMDGDELWLSASVAGGITNVKPSPPNHAVHIGFVIRSHASVGIIYVRVLSVESISELHDVVLTSISDGDILTYDSGTQTWVNGTELTAGATISESQNLVFAGSTNSFNASNDGTTLSIGQNATGPIEIGSGSSQQVRIGSAAGAGVLIGSEITAGANSIGAASTGTVNTDIGNASSTGTTDVDIGTTLAAGATTRVNIAGGSGTNLLAFFTTSAGVAQPVLANGSNEELTTALGSTSGLGLVDDSFTLSPLTQASQTIAFNATRPINGPQRTMYPVDTTGGAFSGTMTGTFLPGDIIRFCDYTSNFATANFTVDFGAHNFQGLASQTVVLNTDDIAVAYEYVDSTRGFQTI